MKKKNKVLAVFGIICIVLGILEIAFGSLICTLDIGEEAVHGMIQSLENTESLNLESIDMKELNITIGKIIAYCIGAIYILEGLFFAIEGGLLRRASKDGKKTTLLIIFLLLGTALQLVTLIGHAINSNYDINSFLDVISVCIKAFVLKKVFEVRRLDMD